MRAVGVHVFAGGFSYGVQQLMHVENHLEVHGFGIETAAAMCGVHVHNSPANDWPDIPAEFAFGNPRCTGFSTITAGYDDNIHGPFADCTRDIWELMNYCTGRYPIFAWESVQQAYSTGRPLINMLVEKAVDAGYRVAHLFINAASLGNAQQRKRYFFVAYDASKNFNVNPMQLPEYSPSLYDAIWHLRNEDNECSILSPDEASVLPWLPNGWDLNMFAEYNYDLLPDRMKDTWLLRNSQMPFSMHCVKRLNWHRPSPTIFSSAGRFIHPDHDRGLSHKEIATIMGLPIVPLGSEPVAQVAKGVCPCVGEWLAEQAIHYINDVWGSEDWECTYNHHTGNWKTRDTTGENETVFDLTHYTQTRERGFPYHEFRMHRHNVDPYTGKPIRPWSEVRESYRLHSLPKRLRDEVDKCAADFPDE